MGRATRIFFWPGRRIEKFRVARRAALAGTECDLCGAPKAPGERLCDECEIGQQTAP